MRGNNMDKRLFEKRYFLWRMFTFSGYISPGQFWSEIAMRIIGYFCAVIILCIVLSVSVHAATERIVALANTLVPILGVLWFIPIIILSRRRLRDAGYSARSYLWLLIPVVGLIVFIVRLCAPTAPREPEKIWFEYN